MRLLTSLLSLAFAPILWLTIYEKSVALNISNVVTSILSASPFILWLFGFIICIQHILVSALEIDAMVDMHNAGSMDKNKE